MSLHLAINLAPLKEQSHHLTDYYTVWSGRLILCAVVVLLFYVVGVFIQQIKFRLLSNSALFIRAVVRGVLIFAAVNSIGVLIASSYMDSHTLERRVVLQDEEKQALSIAQVKKILKLHFKVHVIPVLLSTIIFLTLLFTTKIERKHNKFQGWSATSALIFGIVFIFAYLSSPSKFDKTRFKKKLDSIYLEPGLHAFIYFIVIVLVGCVAGNLF